MQISVRTKVLTTYAILAILVTVVFSSSILRLRQIGTRLNIIQHAYLPIVKTTNSFFNFYHLDETFDVGKIRVNHRNALFIDSITIANPKLMETGLRKGIADAKIILKKRPNKVERRQIKRMEAIVDDLLKQHTSYITFIKELLDNIQSGQVNLALTKNDELIQKKRIVRSRIEFLSRRTDDNIRRGINDTVKEEQRAVLWTLGLAGITLIFASIIGLLALLSLRPLERLKKAAREIAAGDLRQRVDIQSRDEVGALAAEFNRMADSIEQRDEALRKQQEQLVQSERMAVVGRMASKISHEIRNPLNALGLNIEMLNDEMKGKKHQKALSTMSSEIDRLNRVAENYLSVSRTPKLKKEEVNIGEMIERLEVLLQRECEKAEIEMHVDMTKPIPNIQADSARLEQAFLNLVRNAIEITPKKGSFGVNVRHEGNKIVVEVWDKGDGISKDDLPHIFEPFYTTKTKGTGLGLAITNEIIREQGGTIECDSIPGDGTRFRVTLPA